MKKPEEDEVSVSGGDERLAARALDGVMTIESWGDFKTGWPRTDHEPITWRKSLE